MRFNYLLPAVLIALVSLSLLTPKAFADISITALEADGNVIFSFTGSLNRDALELASAPSTPFSTTTRGSIDPSDSAIDFAPSSISAPITLYFDTVASSPPSFGAGGFRSSNLSTGDAFSIDDYWVGLPTGYVDGAPLSGTITFESTTLASMGIDSFGGQFEWILSTGEKVTMTFGAPVVVQDPTEVTESSKLKKKLKKTKKQLKAAKSNKQVARVKKLKKTIKDLKKKIKAL